MTVVGPGYVFNDRYRIVARIGAGAMGAVYCVEDLRDGGELALKAMNYDLFDSDPRALHRFEREARLSAQLRHPNIVQTIDTGFDEDSRTPWLVMERLEGQTLSELVKVAGAPALDRAKQMLSELFSAVISAHAAGIVHRDLKPENIFAAERDGNTVLKVLDFGIAKRAYADNKASLTAAGLGTPLWSAPEQGMSDYQPDPRTDVWALGLLVFYILAGRLYWLHADSRSSMMDLAMELMRHPIQKPSKRVGEIGSPLLIPAELDAWFLRAVCREPDDRYDNAQDAWDALRTPLDAVERSDG